MPKEESEKVDLYYHEKFTYFSKYQQTEFDYGAIFLPFPIVQFGQA